VSFLDALVLLLALLDFFVYISWLGPSVLSCLSFRYSDSTRSCLKRRTYHWHIVAWCETMTGEKKGAWLAMNGCCASKRDSIDEDDGREQLREKGTLILFLSLQCLVCSGCFNALLHPPRATRHNTMRRLDSKKHELPPSRATRALQILLLIAFRRSLHLPVPVELHHLAYIPP
jgi:hypothetical protein